MRLNAGRADVVEPTRCIAAKPRANPIMKASLPFIALLLNATIASAEPELKGTAVELTQYLTAVPQLVALTGESEMKVPADRAVVSLMVVTENKSLQEASRLNQEARARMLRLLVEPLRMS